MEIDLVSGINFANLSFLMARKIRELIPGASYHVCARINRQELIFNTHENEFKKLFMSYLKQAKAKYPFKLYNFVIMGNHIHLQVEPISDTELPRLMQWLLSNFARAYNRHFKYRGHLWYDRYKSKVIKTVRQFINTFLYIANNPVRARLVQDPLAWSFSGIAVLTRKSIEKIPIEKPDKLLSYFIEKYTEGLYFKKLSKKSKFIGF